MTPQSKGYREVSIFYFNTPFFLIFPHFQKYLNPQVTTKKLVNSVSYHSFPSRLASQGYIFLYFFKILRVLSLQNTCWIFSDLYIPTCAGKVFLFVVFTFLENHWIYAFLLMPPVPHPKLLVEFFEDLFLPGYGLLYQNSVRKYEDDWEH